MATRLLGACDAKRRHHRRAKPQAAHVTDDAESLSARQAAFGARSKRRKPPPACFNRATKPFLAYVPQRKAIIGPRSQCRRTCSMTPGRYRRVKPISAHAWGHSGPLLAPLSNSAKPLSVRTARISTRDPPREATRFACDLHAGQQRHEEPTSASVKAIATAASSDGALINAKPLL